MSVNGTVITNETDATSSAFGRNNVKDVETMELEEHNLKISKYLTASKYPESRHLPIFIVLQISYLST